jgi:hypothetical protein
MLGVLPDRLRGKIIRLKRGKADFDGRIILKLIRNISVTMRIGFIWLSIESSNGLL